MEETNKAIVRQYIETVLNQGHVELVDALFAPALHNQVKRIATYFRTAFPDMHETIETLIAEGDTVAARWSFCGTENNPNDEKNTSPSAPPPASFAGVNAPSGRTAALRP